MATDDYNMGYSDGLGDGVSNAKELHEQTKNLMSDLEKHVNKAVGSVGVATKMNADQKFAHQLLVALNLVMSIPNSIYMGFVGSELWGWFVLPNFTSAPHLSIIDFMGLSLLVSLALGYVMTYIMSLQNNKTMTPQFKIDSLATRTFGYPLGLSFILLIGFIYHLFM